MLKRIKTLLERNALIIAIALTITVVYLSLTATPSLLKSIGVSDKSGHLFAYFSLATSWFFNFMSKEPVLKRKLFVSFFLFLLGIALEVAQWGFTESRTADYLDIIANTIGIVIAFLMYNRLLRLYQAI